MERVFRSLGVRNYRLYFYGQLISSLGTWMQTIAQAWLVLRLTDNSGAALGLVTAMQFGPALFLGAWGGVLADRSDKRRLITITQAAMAAAAGGLAVVTFAHVVELWMVYASALATGIATAFDHPARTAFVSEMVPPEQLTNAVGLNSALMTGSRLVGPALAGVIIALWDVGPCFLANAISFLAVIVAMVMIRPGELLRSPPVERAKGQVREGLAYVWRTPDLRLLLCVIALVGLVTFGNFSIVGPLLAKLTFHGDAGTFAVMSSAMGLGSLVGSLFSATRAQPSIALCLGSCVCFGAFIALAAAAPNLAVALPMFVGVGALMMVFLSTMTATVQLAAAPEMRGRVMSLWTTLMLGTTPVCGPMIGYIAERFGPRVAYGQGGVNAIAIGTTAALIYFRRTELPELPAEPAMSSAAAGSQ